MPDFVLKLQRVAIGVHSIQESHDFIIAIEITKEVQIVYRLFLVNCYLLHVSRLPSQPTSNVGG